MPTESVPQITTTQPTDAPSSPTTPTSQPSKPLPPTIITDPSALNDSSRNETPRLIFDSRDSSALPIFDSSRYSSAPPSPSSAISNPELEMTPTTLHSGNNITPHNDSNNPFAFTPKQLSDLIDPKNIRLLQNIGGTDGLIRGLHSDAMDGLSADESAPFEPVHLSDILNEERTGALQLSKNSTKTTVAVMESKREGSATATTSRLSETGLMEDNERPMATSTESKVAHPEAFAQRKVIFGTNILPEVPSKSIFQLMWMAFQDKILILLAVAAIVSLAVGLYEDIALPEPGVARVKWVEGVAIIVAIMLVVTVGSVNDYQKEKQFRKLNAKKEDRAVKAVRSGITQLISVHDIQVGDILHIEPGDIIAADGVFIDGHNLRCDESAATGEADAVKKMNWRECIRFQDMYDSQHPHNEDDARSVSATSGLESPITPSDSHRRSEFLTSNSNNMGGQYLMPPSPASPTAASSSSSDKTKHGNVVLAAGAHLPDPFIISGSKVVEGIGSYVVTSIGVNSFHGKTMMALRTEPEETPLQVKLNDLAEKIAKLGGAAALLMLVVLLIKYFVGWKYHGVPSLPSTIVQEIMQILISTVTIVVVAVPEGLPLAVTLALAYATQRMLKDNNLVRVLSACETMGNATTICSDKTGTLTQNKMSVVAGTFGTSLRFLQDPPASRTDLIALKDLKTRMPKPVLDLVNQAIAVNSTAFESKDNKGTSTFVGSKTETALLGFSRELDAENYDTLRNRWAVEQLYPFSSERKAMATVIRVPVNGDNGKRVSYIYRAHIKGASELLVQCCGGVISTHDEAYSIDSPRTAVEGNEARVKTRKMTPEIQKRMDKIIQSYAGRSLRTIAMCWRDFETWPPHRNGRPIAAAPGDGETVEVAYDDLIADDGLILLGIVGIEDPLRDGVKEAVEQCQKASVFVRMVTGDNVLTAKSIAKQCGIYTHGGIVMEGPVFRQLPTAEMDAVIPRLQVLARSSPEDKRILVHRLKELGEIVAVTGDGTNDGPALKMADVGFSMGIAGTEVAKEASSIILMDDNFSSIVKAIMWGRCVNDAVKKFLQFQLTVNVTAVVLTFVSAVTSNTETSVLTAVQLLWVNLIMDTFAALALATDPPTPELLNRAPESRSAPLISFGMWKMIIGQAIFQLVITIVLLYSDILHLGTGTDGVGVMHTVVFNTFVFLQIFNEINCRVIDNKLNVFKGVLANKFFIFIFIVTVIIQVIITQFGGAAFQTVPLDATHWGICLGLGFVSLPIGVIIRLIPDEIFFFIFRNPETRALYLHQSQPSMPSVYVAGSERMAWNSAYSTVRKQLDVFKSLRGGRLRGSERRLSGTLAAAAMVPSLMATSVGTGWVPQEDGKVREGQVGETSQMDQPSREDTLSPEEDQDTWRKEYLKAQGGKKGKQDSASVKGAVERMKAEEESRPSFEMEER